MLLNEGVCYDQCILMAKLLAFALLHFVLQGQTWLLLQVSLDFLLLHPNPLWWKGHLLSFLRLHLSTAFQTLLLTGRAPPFLLRDSCPISIYHGHLNYIFPFWSILVHWFLKCWCSLLPSPVWPLPIYLDSWTQHSRILCNTVHYSIRLYFHHQTHPQLGIVSTFI